MMNALFMVVDGDQVSGCLAWFHPIMDKCCRTIYLICKRCDEGAVIGKPPNTLLSEDKSIENQNNLVDMLQTSMNDSIAKLEIKMEGLIKSQVEEKLKEITHVNEMIKKQNET